MNAVTEKVLPSMAQLRKMSDRELLAYAEFAGDDEAAWDELNDRGADRQFADPSIGGVS